MGSHLRKYIALPINVGRWASFGMCSVISSALSLLRISLFFIGHHAGSKFTGEGRMGIITGSYHTVQALHSYTSLFLKYFMYGQ